ncbi:sugar phosphate isomerase/epimerase [Rhizobium sp. 32-5/1]|uniref:sugar phosphate isomerase/epimerase family protein n=1 Tax=Rhizobium sp. 32-5/1 TaxID=3019602 RepID=UPI00240CF046|nr:sugar phosphate isomerase/epimerase [Rhizobium sp. 32-5/1]WEZ84460.1 sugar phosphate isomerase/epimerase [Rhizobium sp. 32-5/1]
MKSTELKIGCQTFTWEMLGNAWKGGPDDLLRAIAEGGYSGIEITDTMIGEYADKPEAFVRSLGDAGLTLVSFAFGSQSGFTLPEQIAADMETTRRWVDFAANFPGALVSMGSATVVSDGPRTDKFAVAAECYNRSMEIGKAAGVTVAVHPSSHHNTLLLTRADYDALFALLEPQVGWVPDTGHILRGGQTMADTLAAFYDRIRYVHLKDVDASGTWTMLGEGACDVPAVIAAVRQAPLFNGWIVVEEESEQAGLNPAAAVRANHQALRLMGL